MRRALHYASWTIIVLAALYLGYAAAVVWLLRGVTPS